MHHYSYFSYECTETQRDYVTWQRRAFNFSLPVFKVGFLPSIFLQVINVSIWYTVASGDHPQVPSDSHLPHLGGIFF